MTLNKPIRLLREWRYRNGKLSGWTELNDPVEFPIIGVLKDSEDTYIVETLDAFYCLIPPASDTKPLRFEGE